MVLLLVFMQLTRDLFAIAMFLFLYTGNVNNVDKKKVTAAETRSIGSYSPAVPDVGIATCG